MQELQTIHGTGTQGRVTKKDIISFIANKKNVGNTIQTIDNQNTNTTNLIDTNNILTKPTSIYDTTEGQFTGSATAKLSNPSEVVIEGFTEIIEMDRMRKLIAKHMVESVQTSPHVTSFVEADVTNMVVWREKVKQLFEKREGIKLTFTPMFLECIASILEQYPIVNSSLQGDQIILKKDINIGMATALSTGNLIVPVIKGANQLSIVGISKAVNNLAIAARNNQLKPQDTQGGTFTVTNVGSFGSIMGTPIINQPQVAILALGAIKKRPVVVETPSGDAILVRHMMFLSMSYDHRIVDGAMGSQFLAAVAKAFEAWDPNRQWFQYV
jgi:2-oxoglutarate dehydrogenase E2 component (dihydrolipoamide succinyltransferase)